MLTKAKDSTFIADHLDPQHLSLNKLCPCYSHRVHMFLSRIILQNCAYYFFYPEQRPSLRGSNLESHRPSVQDMDCSAHIREAQQITQLLQADSDWQLSLVYTPLSPLFSHPLAYCSLSMIFLDLHKHNLYLQSCHLGSPNPASMTLRLIWKQSCRLWAPPSISFQPH